MVHFYQLRFCFVTATGRKPERSIPLRVLRGLFLRLLKDVNPDLATKVHDSGNIPPYVLQLHVDGPRIWIVANLYSKDLNAAVSESIVRRNDVRSPSAPSRPFSCKSR